jgi:hypothetical protein
MVTTIAYGKLSPFLIFHNERLRNAWDLFEGAIFIVKQAGL